jgi:hypothetical protein
MRTARLNKRFLVILLTFFVLLPTVALAQTGTDASKKVEEAALTPTLSIDIPSVEFSKVEVTEEGSVKFIDVPWLMEYLSGVYKYAIGIGVFLAGVMIMIGGLIYLTSGDSGRVSRGKTLITDAILGLAVLLGSFVLLNTLNPQLTTLRSLFVMTVNPEKFVSLEPAVTGPEGLPDVNCSEPGYKITTLDSYNPSIGANRNMERVLRSFLSPSRVAMYKKAGSIANVPWQALAAIHFKEGAGRGSAANGKKICNNNDDPNLYKYCPECKTNPSVENDIICAAKHLAKKVPLGQNPSIDALKTAFCRYNGCYGKYNSCPDGHPYVASLFDKETRTSKKQGQDCVPVSCKEGCVADVVNKSGGKTPGRGCCAIRVYKSGSEPAGYNPGGSKCNSVVKSSCITKKEAGGTILTYTYNRNMRTKDNPCGSWLFQARAGALNAYAAIKNMEKAGTIK